MSSIHERYNLKQVINASGRMTALGVSTPPAEVVDAVRFAMGQYFEMDDLVAKTGAYIAKLLGVEAATVVSCASAGIALSVAAVVVREDAWVRDHLHDTPARGPNEIVMAKGHNVNFGAPIGTMVGLGGGKVVEAGWGNECFADQLEAAVGPNTAAILYVKSHHVTQERLLTVEEAVAVAKKCKVPLIIDAAAEEDLRCYYEAGADIVIYSGAKAIEGPTSGLVIGRKQYVDLVRQQSKGIGRAMKVGKEGIIGLATAIEGYLNRKTETGASMVERLEPFFKDLAGIDGVSTRVSWDSAGRDIARGEIVFDEKKLKRTARDIVATIRKGPTAIYFREHGINEGRLGVDVRSVNADQLKIIASAIRAALA